MFEHLQDLKVIMHYVCPNHRVQSVIIPEGVEYVEVISGGKVIFDEDGSNRVYGPGTIFWHQTGDRTIHKSPENDLYRCFVFIFSVSEGSRPCPRITCPANGENLLEIARLMFRMFHGNAQINGMMKYSVYSTLASFALGPQSTAGSDYPASLEKALHFIQRNLSASILLSDIAENSRISQPYLFMLFKKYLKTSPHQYLLDLRIERAKQLLAGGELSIKEVSLECGFENIEVFYRRFSGRTGMKPAEYRKKYHPPELLAHEL